MTLMNKFTHITKVKYNFEAELRGTNPGEIRLFSNIFPKSIARSFYSQFSSIPIHKLKKDDINELINMMSNFNSGTGFINDIDQDINKEVVARIICPTLIIHSKNDNSVPVEHAVYANRMISPSNIITLQNEWGHLLWIGSDSEKSIGYITEFIENEH